MSVTEKACVETESRRGVEPALRLNFLSHGTLESREIEWSCKYYEEFLGLEVVQTSAISLLIRLGGDHVIAVVKSKKAGGEMGLLNHNVLDVRTEEELDEAHRIVTEQAEQWRLTRITRPVLRHGTYSFFFWDSDANCWEILTNPEDGYHWLFDIGDQQGKGYLDRNFKRPGFDG